MLERGVEGDLFHEHDETDDCKRHGCVPKDATERVVEAT